MLDLQRGLPGLTDRIKNRDALEALVDSAPFQQVIMALIVVNAAILGLMTSETVRGSIGGLLSFVDDLILIVFVLEIALRIAAKRGRFFQSGWSWFDLLVVAVSIMPATGNLSVLRSLRVLRLLRLVSVSKRMRRVVEGFFAAIPGMATVLGVLGIVYYTSAVIATNTFGASADPGMQEMFGTLGRSFFTLFQLMTLEDWADGIVKPTVDLFPWALLFFIPYIFVTSFAVLNLFIGIIVDAMQEDREEAMEQYHEAEETAQQDRFDQMMSEIRALRSKVTELNESLDRRLR